MDIYIPTVFRSFPGFKVIDIKEFRKQEHLEIHLEHDGTRHPVCRSCEWPLGAIKDRYRIKARHLRVMNWSTSVVFYRYKRFCENCEKVRSEKVEFLSPTSSHVTMELAWWLNRLTEITSVLSVSKLESIDKQACYRVDKFILRRLMQGYRIPTPKAIGVDEVYARSPRQQKENETRDDLFLTVIVDLKTHKVIWVSQSRRKEALDEFFMLLGKENCKKIEVVATDQHDGYAASIREHCPNATQVWDRFHLVQQFNEALNEDRKREYEDLDPESKNYSELGALMRGRYKYIFLTKASKRIGADKEHFNHVAQLNEKISRLEIIKEHFHKIFDCQDEITAQIMMAEIYEWSFQARAWTIFKWVKALREESRFWNYFKFKVTTSINEGVNRVIKGIKWQAYGYKDMTYFALKILQKAGYLNSQFHNGKFSSTA